ncbi:beta-1,4-galactosyltransferase 2-like [Styela clava]
MSNKETESERLLSEAPTLEVTRQGTGNGTSLSVTDLTEIPYKWMCCNFRIRVVCIVLLLLLQLPILGYYYVTSDNYIMKFTNSYKDVFMEEVFGQRVNTNLTTTQSMLFFSTATHQFTKSNFSDETTVSSTTISTRNVFTTNADKTLSNFSPTLTTVINKAEEDTTVLKLQTNATTAVVTTTQSTVANPTTVVSTSFPTTDSHYVAEDGSILSQCPPEPPNLQGPLAISFKDPPDSFEKTVLNNPLVTDGGHAKPPLCLARHKLAIIIPYRDRVQHLQYFVEYMHPILQRQQLDYQIFIINQAGHGKFNRAKLMNVGFLEALKLYPFTCFAFHDVDLVLEDDRSLYWCSDRPRHLSAGVDKFNYVLPYSSIFGGVTLLSKEHMEAINGFSNEFWGWGGEDDDVYNRLNIKGFKIIRYPMNIARYKMITHKHEKGNEANPRRFEMIRKTRLTYQKDGLNSIQYKVLSVEQQPLYTNVTVDILGPP